MTPRRILAYGLVVALATAALAVVSRPRFSTLDLKIYDAMLRTAKTKPASDRIAIVAVDDRSLSEIGQWPWPRDVMARLIDRIRDLGARVVALDLLLAEPDRYNRDRPNGSPTTDSMLAASLSRGRVVMSYAFTFEPASANDGGCVIHPIDVLAAQGAGGASPVEELFTATGVVCSLPELTRAAGASGYLNASADPDGILRRIPLLVTYRGQTYPSLALAAVARAAGAPPLTLTAASRERAEFDFRSQRIPLDERGTLPIRFRAEAGSYVTLSAVDVLQGRVAADRLKDRIVFVGATALGVRAAVATPLDTARAGVEVHAAAADTLLQGDVVTTPPYWRVYELFATCVFGLMAAALVAVTGLVAGSALSAALLVVTWWATSLGVESKGIFLSPLFPGLAMLFVLTTLVASKLAHERRRAESEQDRRERAHHFAVQSLTSLVETRDGATGQHARRTQEYARVLASRLALVPALRQYLTPERIDLIARLSPLHDIGKVAIRDAVLNKPGALSTEEYDEIRRHPEFGHATLTTAERLAGIDPDDETLVQLAKDIVYTHHERWDGCGYPRGLTGDEIPLAGRIVALVDVYDALSNTRSYRDSLTHDQAVATIVAGRGTHFDPAVVDAFVAVAETFRALSERYRDGAAGAPK